MIGLMTLTWAWAENALALTIGIILENVGEIRGHKEAPLLLKGRISCLRNALKDIPALHGLHERGYAITVRFKQLAPRRNDLTHGAAWQLDQGGFQSMGFAVTAGQYAVKDHSFNVTDAGLLIIEIQSLADDASLFMLSVRDAFG